MEVFSKVYGQKILSFEDYIYHNSIKIDKLWEKHNCDMIASCIVPGTDFLDIGANIGLISLAVKNSVTDGGKIHCFECDNKAFNMLCYNTHEHKNILLYNFGLYDKHSVGHMTVNTSNFGCNHFHSTMQETFDYKHNENAPVVQQNTIYFSLIPLDFVKDLFTNRVSVIKIDVEGLEYNVLKGAREVILKHKPVIFIEIFKVNYEKVLELLCEYGYNKGQKLEGIEDYVFYAT